MPYRAGKCVTLIDFNPEVKTKLWKNTRWTVKMIKPPAQFQLFAEVLNDDSFKNERFGTKFGTLRLNFLVANSDFKL
jgi:hypothetical protein